VKHPAHDRSRRARAAESAGAAPILHVARLCLVQAGPASPEPPRPAEHRRFCRAADKGAGAITVPVRFEQAQRIPAPRERLFRAGAWSLAREGRETMICVDTPGDSATLEVLVRLRVGSAPSATVLHCDPAVPPLAYPVDQALVMYLLASRAGAILHAAGFAAGGRGVAFLGRSGAGKTTVSRLLLGRRGWQALSDDRVVVRAIGGRHLLFGTPWPGDAGIAQDASCPLAALCFLRQGAEHRLERLAPRQVLERLLPVASVPWFDADALAPALDFLGGLAAAVPAWELCFRRESSLAAFLEAHLSLGAQF
jgi:hypothetical protein